MNNKKNQNINKMLVVTDLDGTVMPTVDRLPAENMYALRYVGECGGMVMIATARPYGMCKHIYDLIYPNMPLCVLNGAMVYDKEGNVIANHFIDRDTVTGITKTVIERVPELSNIVIEHGDDFYTVTEPKNVYMKEEIKRIDRKELDLTCVPETEAHRLMFYTSNEDSANVLYKIVKTAVAKKSGYILRDKITVKRNGDTVYRYEISNRNATKWNAVKMIAEKYGIENENIWCFGDEWNDFEMVANAAHGYAIKGSKAEVHGRFVTNSPAATLYSELLKITL